MANKLKKASILRLVDWSKLSKMQTPLDMLKDEVKAFKIPGLERFKKAIVIYLNETNDYETEFASAGMDRQEIIMLLEVVKARFMAGLIGDDNH